MVFTDNGLDSENEEFSMPYLILTLIGPDRPGLVESVAAVVREQDGNWLESRMAHLAGQFAGIVRVEVAEKNADDLLRALEGLASVGLTVTARKDSIAGEKTAVPLVRLELVGNDQPGIVSKVTHVLTEHKVNVEEFHSECVEAPNSGSTLFRATAELRLPDGLSTDQLQQAVEAIALDVMVDIHAVGTASEV